MNHSSLVFSCSDYKNFLTKVLTGPHSERGLQKKLADMMGCQASYLSQVLKDPKKDLHRDQIANLAQGLKLSELASLYLLHLYDLHRCESSFHESLIRSQMEEVRSKNRDLSHRLKANQSNKQLPEDVLAEYYSSWVYGAVHMAVAMPQMTTAAAIANHLNIESVRVIAIINFLLNHRFIEEKEKAGWKLTQKSLHLSKYSPHHVQNLTQWRLKCLQNIQGKGKNDRNIQSSFCFTLSESDYRKISQRLFKTITELHTTMQKSPSEKLAVLNLDFFEI